MIAIKIETCLFITYITAIELVLMLLRFILVSVFLLGIVSSVNEIVFFWIQDLTIAFLRSRILHLRFLFPFLLPSGIIRLHVLHLQFRKYYFVSYFSFCHLFFIISVSLFTAAIVSSFEH